MPRVGPAAVTGLEALCAVGHRSRFSEPGAFAPGPHHDHHQDNLVARGVAHRIQALCIMPPRWRIGVFADDLRTVEPWAEAIKEEVLARRMPPWNAVKGFGGREVIQYFYLNLGSALDTGQ